MKLTHLILFLAATAAAFAQSQGPAQITVGTVTSKAFRAIGATGTSSSPTLAPKRMPSRPERTTAG
jgi:hypothetical protein